MNKFSPPDHKLPRETKTTQAQQQHRHSANFLPTSTSSFGLFTSAFLSALLAMGFESAPTGLLWFAGGICGLLILLATRLFSTRVPVYRPRTEPFATLEQCATGDSELRILTLNLWSGSTYEFVKSGPDASLVTRALEMLTGTGSVLEFYPGEDIGRRQKRLEAVVSEIKESASVKQAPAVITLNEVLPCSQVALRLADELGYDCISHVGVAGIRIGQLFEFPTFSEGDAILAHPNLKLEFAGRQALTGQVFSSRFSLNTGDATQALAGIVSIPRKSTSSFELHRRASIVVTHWHAGLLEDKATLKDIDALGTENSDDLALAKAEVSKGSAGRTMEALGTLKLAEAVESHHADLIGTVLCGDLNTTRYTPEFEVLTKAPFVHDLLESPTWDPENNPNVRSQISAGVEGQSLRSAVINQLYAQFSERAAKLDHILAKPAQRQRKVTISAVREMCRDERQGVVASDHYGVIANIVFS